MVENWIIGFGLISIIVIVSTIFVIRNGHKFFEKLKERQIFGEWSSTGSIWKGRIYIWGSISTMLSFYYFAIYVIKPFRYDFSAVVTQIIITATIIFIFSFPLAIIGIGMVIASIRRLLLQGVA